MQDKPLGNVASLAYFGPELVLIGAMLMIIVWDLAARSPRRQAWGAILLGLGAMAYSAGVSVQALLLHVEPQQLFGGMLAFDRFAALFRVLFAIVTAVTVVLVTPGLLAEGPQRREHAGSEMVMLLVTVTLGMNLMAAARNLLMIYLSLEMVSVLSFVLAGYKLGDKKSSEGALKYVIYGGVASGVMLYGMSWLYGLSGSLDLGRIADMLAARTLGVGHLPAAAFVAAVLVLVGFGYKIAAVPFHMWTPDVYEGAPTPVTAFLSVGPKAAGFAVLVRFFAEALGARGLDVAAPASSLGGAPWAWIAGVLAIGTMTVGNLSALHQDNVKRLLAYSSIAHAGYLLLGFSVFSDAGRVAIGFYLLVYCFMNLGAFLVVMAVAERSRGDETLASFRGLGKRAPVMAVLMAIFLFSLAGIPPLAGFVGKFYLFAALIAAGGVWYWVLAIIGVANSVLSLFYYARVLRAMYLDSAEAPQPVRVRWAFGLTGLAMAIPTLLLGVYWGPAYDFVAGALQLGK